MNGAARVNEKANKEKRVDMRFRIRQEIESAPNRFGLLAR
jgi:hypothetical protein